ncbi:MAG: dTDP-4-dehydrorhamnose reductase [Actinomycetota bacterium]|nr:dTDP-4-dehydrorhamnose reductase [Actinomycetota bacterium]
MRLLITGAAGMLGRDVTLAARAANHEVVALAREELDLLDRRRVRRTLDAEAPHAVINCAAWTDVDGAESGEETATAINGTAAGFLARAAAEVDAAIVHPSTDYVFDGSAGRPYVESDPPSPVNAYGRSKLAGEHAVAAENPRHFVVRTSWLFGPHGPNFVETMLGLAGDRAPVLVVRDQVGCPTYTGHLAEALVRLVDGESYGIHHIAGQGECSWWEFANEIFAQVGVESRALSCSTEEFPRPARRPAHAVLRTERDYGLELPHWKDGLAGYLAERAVAR